MSFKNKIIKHLLLILVAGIAFTACKIYKELERHLKEKKSELSPEKVMDILKTIYKITITTPYSKSKHARLLIKNDEQRVLMDLFNLDI